MHLAKFDEVPNFFVSGFRWLISVQDKADENKMKRRWLYFRKQLDNDFIDLCMLVGMFWIVFYCRESSEKREQDKPTFYVFKHRRPKVDWKAWKVDSVVSEHTVPKKAMLVSICSLAPWALIFGDYIMRRAGDKLGWTASGTEFINTPCLWIFGTVFFLRKCLFVSACWQLFWTVRLNWVSCPVTIFVLFTSFRIHFEIVSPPYMQTRGQSYIFLWSFLRFRGNDPDAMKNAADMIKGMSHTFRRQYFRKLRDSFV